MVLDSFYQYSGQLQRTTHGNNPIYSILFAHWQDCDLKNWKYDPLDLQQKKHPTAYLEDHHQSYLEYLEDLTNHGY